MTKSAPSIPESPTERPRNAWWSSWWFGCALLLAGVGYVYWGLGTHDFIACDDPDYVYQNDMVRQGLTWPGVGWAFTTGYANNWHPLAWISHMLDCQIFGVNAGRHHLVSLGFHALNSVLLFLVLRRMTRSAGRSFFVAALFALHPLHVESVAWLSERKDVLSTCFGLLAVWAYWKSAECGVRSAEKPNDECRMTNKKAGNQLPAPNAPPSSVHVSRFTFQAPRFTFHVSRFYFLSLAFFALSLLSKPMLVTLPALLLLLDLWPLGRVRLDQPPAKWFPASLLLEKVPFLLLSIATSLITIIVQSRNYNMTPLSMLPIGTRVANAVSSYAIYLKMMFWPANLAAFYPYPKGFPIELVAGSALVLAAATFAAFKVIRTRPWFAMGWFWYLISLVPVIGFIQVGPQAYADRYTYVPLIGLFVALTWGVCEWWRGRPVRWLHPGLIAAPVLVACAMLARQEAGYWQNSETLYRRALLVTQDNALAHVNLGCALVAKGDFAHAEPEFEEAMRIRPDYPEALCNCAFTRARKGDLDAAIELYRRALTAKPSLGQAHCLLANALNAKGQQAEAVAEYRLALQFNPGSTVALNDLAWLLATTSDNALRQPAEALRLAQELCRRTDFKEAQFVGTLAAAYAANGEFDQAVAHAEKAIALAAADDQKELVERNQALLERYRARKPVIEPASKPE
jgi:Flp pilus assembly protein TadD